MIFLKTLLSFLSVLKPKQIFFILIIIAASITTWVLRGKFHSCPKPETKVETVIVYEPVIDPQVKPEFIEKIVKDTVYSIDTFIVDKTQYIAQMDTTYRDSLLYLNVQYISPSPLDKRSYFSIDAKVREKIITRTNTITKPITYSNDFFVEGGIRADTTINYFIGGGVNALNFKYLELPIKYEYNHNSGGGTHSISTSLKIKF